MLYVITWWIVPCYNILYVLSIPVYFSGIYHQPELLWHRTLWFPCHHTGGWFRQSRWCLKPERWLMSEECELFTSQVFPLRRGIVVLLHVGGWLVHTLQNVWWSLRLYVIPRDPWLVVLCQVIDNKQQLLLPVSTSCLHRCLHTPQSLK